MISILVASCLLTATYADILPSYPPLPVMMQWGQQAECSTNPPEHSCAAYMQTHTIDDLMADFMITTSNDPDGTRRTPELISSKGYPVETHEVTTGDGYILEVHRIPYSPNNASTQGNTNKPAVLIMHGLMGAGHDWLLNLKQNCLPFILADAGYDVWIGSNRGTSYSRKHSNATFQTSAAYWKFSFNEMGTQDLPAMIDYILLQKGQSSLYYVGFSQGTTQYFVMLSEKPQYNAKIKYASLLGPVAYLSNTTNPFFQTLAQVAPIANAVLNITNGQITSPSGSEMGKYFVCKQDVASQMACGSIIFGLFGFNFCEMNCSRIPIYLAHDPEGVAARDYSHMFQLMKSREFRQYDERIIAASDGVVLIGDNAPKEYNLNNVLAKASLYSGKFDNLANPIDVAMLETALTNTGALVKHKKIDTYAHVDFYWGLTVKETVYDDVLAMMRTH